MPRNELGQFLSEVLIATVMAGLIASVRSCQMPSAKC